MITTGPSPPKQMLFHAEINSGLSCPRDEPGMAAATHPALEPGLGKGSLSLPRSRGGSEKGFKKELRLFDSCAEDFPGAARRGSIPVVGTGLVPRCCLQPSRAPAARGEEGTGGAFFLAGKKKKSICFQFSSSYSGWLQENVFSAARDTAVATATAERGDSLPLPPSAPPK